MATTTTTTTTITTTTIATTSTTTHRVYDDAVRRVIRIGVVEREEGVELDDDRRLIRRISPKEIAERRPARVEVDARGDGAPARDRPRSAEIGRDLFCRCEASTRISPGRDCPRSISRLPEIHSAVIARDLIPPGPHVAGAAIRMRYVSVAAKSWYRPKPGTCRIRQLPYKASGMRRWWWW